MGQIHAQSQVGVWTSNNVVDDEDNDNDDHDHDDEDHDVEGSDEDVDFKMGVLTHGWGREEAEVVKDWTAHLAKLLKFKYPKSIFSKFDFLKFKFV